MSLSKIPWFLLVVFSLAFGLMSIEYTFYLYSDSSTYTNILNDLTSWLVSHDYAFWTWICTFFTKQNSLNLNRFFTEPSYNICWFSTNDWGISIFKLYS